MAKRKHSTALFEVIKQDKRFANIGRPPALATPSWFRNNVPASVPARTPAAPSSERAAQTRPVASEHRATTAPAIGAPAMDASHDTALSASTTPKSSASRLLPLKEMAASILRFIMAKMRPAPLMQPGYSQQSRGTPDRSAPVKPLNERAGSEPSASDGPPPRCQPSAQTGSTKTSQAESTIAPRRPLLAGAREWLHTHAALNAPVLAGAGALIVLLAAIAIYHHRHSATSAGDAPAVYVSTEQLRKGPPHPSVLDLSGGAPTSPRPSSPGRAQATNSPDAVNPSQAAQAQSAAAPGAARQVNMNYVLVQSYGDEKTANEARDFLNANGVPCTIERDIPGWRKDFYLVVGLDPFTRTSTPDFKAYRMRIETLSEKFAPKGGYRKFTPLAIKWK